MCFYDSEDCDWMAEISEITRQRSNKVRHCYECREEIQIGDWHESVSQQEHEDCHCDYCETRDYDESFDCSQCDGVFGETFECDICDDCRLIRHAIYQVELDEGCPPENRQPGYGGLADVFIEHSSKNQYARTAIRMFPEISGNKLLALAWKDF